MAEMKDDAEMQRAIGRIEGQNGQIITKLNAIIGAQIKHEDLDREEFASTRRSCEKQVSELRDERRARDETQDLKIEKLEKAQQRAQGAGWVILGLLTALASFVGAAVISILSGHVGIKWQ